MYFAYASRTFCGDLFFHGFLLFIFLIIKMVFPAFGFPLYVLRIFGKLVIYFAPAQRTRA